MKKDVEQKTTEVQHGMVCDKGKIEQFESNACGIQERFDRISSRARRLKSGADRSCDQLIENLQLDLQNYLMVSCEAIETLTTTHCAPLDGCVNLAVTSISDGLGALMETVEGLHAPPANDT